jgi:hypothetical protein
VLQVSIARVYNEDVRRRRKGNVGVGEAVS